ncbi:MAG: hypothetical protein Q8Q59_09580 [Luteolibacter sp.]|jgi:hypothetical protein|nr:hypothetical protein [Luteolibacter sp.]
MKNLAIFLCLLLSACSDKPKTISTEVDFREILKHSGSVYYNLNSIVKLKKIGTDVFWSLDILNPETDVVSDKARAARTGVFHWLKNPDLVSGSPYILIEFKDEDGFVLESTNNQHKTASLVDEFHEEKGISIERLRTQGSFIDEKARFGAISACNVKITCNEESKKQISSWMKSTLQKFDDKN